MHVLRRVFALSLCLSLCTCNFQVYAGGKPLGILTLAYGAHLNASDAFAGLSVFDGERLSTDTEGKVSARVGGSVITMIEKSAAILQRSGNGAHIDLEAGSQAQILMFAPKVLQITTRQGSLDFVYGKEFRVLPEGQTYRIYLESEDGPGTPPPAGSGTEKPGQSTGTKVAYFILAGAGAGLAAWGIHDLIQSHNGVESPAKP
jgi:hypothetical protein